MTDQDYNALVPGDTVVVTTTFFNPMGSGGYWNLVRWQRGSFVQVCEHEHPCGTGRWAFRVLGDVTSRYFGPDEICSPEQWAAQILTT